MRAFLFFVATALLVSSCTPDRVNQSANVVPAEERAIRPLSNFFVCHGERDSICEISNGWNKDADIYVACGGSAPNETAAGLCGSGNFGMFTVQSRSGGRCGYHWYRVTCR